MKTIKILKMLIMNFKNIKHLEVEMNGKNINLIGVNGSGKTSVFDAFTWCLFGKDSKDRADSNKDFVIKPHTKDGQAIHNLETSVELVLSIDGRQVQLKRVYSEVWAKKRGSEERELTGHTTEYFVNGVPRKKSEYEEFIRDEIISEDIFKTLTNVGYFTSLNWKDQRALLEKLATKSDLEIIEETPSLELLKNELIFDRTVEDVVKIQKDTQRKINEQLNIEIPAKINALHNIKYETLDNFNYEENERKLQEAYKKLSDIEGKLASGSNQAEVQELEKSKFEYERLISKLEREIEEFKREHLDKVQSEKAKLYPIEREVNSIQSELKNTNDRIENGKKLIAELEEKLIKLREEYKAIKAEEFQDANCKYCGQVLPADKLEEAQAHFNKHQSERLEKNIEVGKKTKEDIEKYQKGIEELKGKVETLTEKLNAKNSELETQKQVIAALENTTPELIDEINNRKKEIERNQERIITLDNQIKKAKEKGTNEVLENARKEIKNEIEYLNIRKSEWQIYLQNQEKIKKLEAEQKELQEKFEEAQKLINLCEEFRLVRAKALEDEVNNNFKLVKFTLFQELLNGAIEPTCVATYNGVLYPSCSTGEKINIGLDIINGLQKIYGVSAPIFIDNAEAVSNWLVETGSQLVKMFVDPEVKELKIMKEEVK